MSNARDLFRREVYEKRRHQWLGRPQIVSGRFGTAFSMISFILIAGFIILISFGTYTRREAVEGIIVPSTGLVRIASPSQGWLEVQNITPGASVNAGELIFRISTDTYTDEGATGAHIAEILRDRIYTIERKIELYNERRELERIRLSGAIGSARDDMHVLESVHDELIYYQSVLEEALDRERDLYSQGLSTSSNVEERLLESMNQKLDIERIGLESTELRIRQSELEAELRALDNIYDVYIAEFQMELSNAMSDIALNDAGRTVDIVAPRSGKVVSISRNVGQLVDVGTPLATLVPENSMLDAVFLVPSRSIGLLEVGSKVALRYAAYPYQKFGQYDGAVVDVSLATMTAEEAQISSLGTTQGNQPTFKVTVRPTSKQIEVGDETRVLLPGMEVEAHVFSETRYLWEWLFEPFFGRGVVQGSAPS